MTQNIRKELINPRDGGTIVLLGKWTEENNKEAVFDSGKIADQLLALMELLPKTTKLTLEVDEKLESSENPSEDFEA